MVFLPGKWRKSKIVHLCFAISFLSSGVIINIMQGILFYGLKPFNKKLYRSIGYYLCYSFYSQIIFLMDWWSESKLYLYVDEDVLNTYIGKEHAFLIMNHSYEIDWIFGWLVGDKYGVLGNCKAFAKKVLQYIPAMGLSWKFAEFVFLARSFEKDRDTIGRQIHAILEYPDPVWLMLSAEGTRFTQKKHEASMQFARERGMPELKHHLIPRTKGFTTSIPHLQEKCPALYDVHLVVPLDGQVKPTVANLLHGRSIIAHIYVRRFDIKSIPITEEAAAEWLQNLYREKDALHESFIKHGDFFTGTDFKPVKPILLKPRISSLLNTLVWACITLSAMFYYLVKLLFSGELLLFSIGAGIIFIFYLLMLKTIKMSQVNEGASNSTVQTKQHDN